MDLHYKQATAVGALVLTAAGAFLAGTLWLQGRSINAGNLYTIAFTDIGNLKRGTAVRVSGVEVGSVERIDFRAVGDVAVRMSLSNQQVTPRVDATASIASVGIIGDVVLAYDPGTATEPLSVDDEIMGTMSGGFSEMGAGLIGKMETLMDSLAVLFTQRLSDDMHNTLVASQQMFSVFSDTTGGPIGELTRTLAAMRGLSVRMDSTLASQAFQGTLTNLDSATASFNVMAQQLAMTTARLDTMLLNINNGQGTLGKLATDSTLYQGLLETQQSLKAFIDTLTATPGKLNLKVELF
jgi:phospholipid/cholesterol/gamma-HCH transport system substrate-binding protein